MILAYAILALFVAALVFRPDFARISRVQFRGGGRLAVIVAGLFALQWVLVITQTERTTLHMALLLLSHTAAILLVWLNRHLPGAPLFALGLALNTVVMAANGGWMPVTPEIVQYVKGSVAMPLVASGKNIILPQANTHLWLLSDIIPVAMPWRRWALSPGDVLLVAAAAQFLFRAAPPLPAPVMSQV